MQVVIADSAFVTIVAMAIETYKNECIGMLYGHKVQNGFTIEYALPHQTAKRKLTEVNTYGRRLRSAINAVNELTPTVSLIGDYHSHTDYNCPEATTEPSDEDMRSMVVGWIYLVIALEKRQYKIAWHQLPTGVIRGSIGSTHIRVAAYYKKEADAPLLASLWVAPGIMLPCGIGTFDNMVRSGKIIN